ncbi:MAG: SIMPL domain-containing protein [Eubacteriaceae bacterium]|nr:SIMPL domain-containing protein [Eubacteriaceae bacterium]
MANKTITITGEGKAATKPDEIILSMGLSSLKDNYKEALKADYTRSEALSAALIGCGFKKEDIKTASYNINTLYENEKQEEGEYKSVFKGYVCNREMSVSFGLDIDRLGMVLEAVSVCEADMNISILFGVKDIKSLKEKALRAATTDAFDKAQILEEACNIKLGELIRVDYSSQNTDYYPQKNSRAFYLEGGAGQLQLEPTDTEITDSVICTWEIL